MKRTIISTISVVVLSTVLSGCMDKLEILPNDQIITEKLFRGGFSRRDREWCQFYVSAVTEFVYV